MFMLYIVSSMVTTFSDFKEGFFLCFLLIYRLSACHVTHKPSKYVSTSGIKISICLEDEAVDRNRHILSMWNKYYNILSEYNNQTLIIICTGLNTCMQIIKNRGNTEQLNMMIRQVTLGGIRHFDSKHTR